MRELYDALWRDARAGFADNLFESDPLIDDPGDTRRGLSLIFRFRSPESTGLVDTSFTLRDVAEEQYFHAPSELHVTLLSVITCIDGFTLGEVESERYVALAETCIMNVEPFTLTFRGITASPSCVMAQGFTESGALQELRERLRKAITVAGLRHSMDHRYAARTAHVTLMRLRCPPHRPNALVERLDALRDVPIGTGEIEAVELVFNDWYHRHENVVYLARMAFAQ